MKHTAEPWKIEKVTGWQGNTVYCRITSEHFTHPGGIAYASIPLTGRTKKQKELAGVYKSQGDALCQYNAKRIIECVNALAGIENPSKLDFEFIAQALNAHWNAMNWNLTEVKDLGDIERKNYEYAREKAKEQLALLTQ